MEYVHGGDIYRTPVEYDFSVNINPLGMPAGSIRAAHEGILLSGRYPDYRGERLCAALGERKQIDEKHIFLGNGAAELIYTFCHTLLPKRVLIPVPTFQEYEAAVSAVGGTVRYYMLREENGFALDEGFLEAIDEDTDVVFLCNPNNPTGRLIDSGLMRAVIARCEMTDTWLLVDECFMPFVAAEQNRSVMNLADKGKRSPYGHDKLLLLRAFTKIYGMPGLRLGYMVSSNEELLEGMQIHSQPWNTSVPAQMAGLAALRDEAFLAKTGELIAAERGYLTHELSLGLAEKLYDSDANFILLRAARDLYDRLLERGVMLRRCGNFPGLTNEFYRIAVRSHSENQELIRRWRGINQDIGLGREQ